MIISYIQGHQLEVVSMALGLLYLWCEYRASILLWFVGIIMPLVDIVLYWQNGLYADSAMDVYYALMAVYGFAVWRRQSHTKHSTLNTKHSTLNTNQSPLPSEEIGGGSESEVRDTPISHLPLRRLPAVVGAFFVIWAVVYLWLRYGTPSTVPVMDSFVNALCIIGLWALSRKYLEQWFLWIVVDAIKTYLYAYKGIPVKGSYYALSVVIAVMGYRKWRRMMKTETAP